MEGLVLHGAAHIFFENKLGELETHINIKFKKIEAKLKKEMREIFQYQHHEISKLKLDIKEVKEELAEIRQSEENLSNKGMAKITKLTKEVKTELNEIKKLKTDVTGLKKEVKGIQQSEEDLSKLGMDTLSKISEDFKTEIKQVKTDMKSVKKDIVSIKQAFKTKMETEDGDSERFETPEPDKPRSGRKKTNSYREANKFPPTIVELLNSSEEDQERMRTPTQILEMLSSDKEEEGAVGLEKEEQETRDKDNYMENFNDDHIRCLNINLSTLLSYVLYVLHFVFLCHYISGSLCLAPRSRVTTSTSLLTTTRATRSVKTRGDTDTAIRRTTSREYFLRNFFTKSLIKTRQSKVIFKAKSFRLIEISTK